MQAGVSGLEFGFGLFSQALKEAELGALCQLLH